jgi:hypothetical protein
MTANTPGSYPTERVDRRTVLPAKVATFTEQRRIENISKVWVGGKAGVAVEPNKSNSRRENGYSRYCENLGKFKIKGFGFYNSQESISSRDQYQPERRKS